MGLGSYTAAFERIEQRLEEFDVQAMRGEGADEDIELLSRCASGRQTATRTGGAPLALVALTHPELEALGDNASGERFQSLFTRFEATLQEARDVREAIVGSFDVLIARGGHHTNQIMKVLTLASVILLPGALLAGVMGMNFKVGLFDNPTLLGRHRRHRGHGGADHRDRGAPPLDLTGAAPPRVPGPSLLGCRSVERDRAPGSGLRWGHDASDDAERRG